MKKEVLINNQQLQAVFEQAAVGMVIVDAAQNRFVKVNRRFCEIVGYSAEELLQRSIHDITHPDDVRMDRNHVDPISAGTARESSWEKRYRKKDGTVIWARAFVTPLDPSEAKPTLRLGVIEEITEQKRVEEALRWSETQLQAILESTADGILAVDNKGRVIKTNRRFADLWRIPQSLMDTGDDRTLLDFVMNQLSDPDAFVKKVRLLYDSDTVDEDTLAFKDGRVFERFTFPMIMEGVIIGRVWSFRDITESKRIEKELSDSEERYRRIVEASSDAVLLRSTESIIYANPAALKLFRANHPEDLIGKRYLDLVHPDDLAISAERVKKTLDENWIAPPREHRLLALDGQVVHVESTGVPVKYRGEIHVFGIFRDITERKRTEQEINTLADIGRIIGSTMNIEEVYERFAEAVRKIVPFDRIVINIIDVEMNTVINVYIAGHGITDRIVGARYPLKGSGNFEMVRTKSSLLIQTEDFDEYTERFPMLLSTFQAGFRSIMNIPLFLKGKIVGGLLLRSFKPHAYTDHDVRLAERVGNHIAGAIVNAQLFTELKKTEQGLKESEQRYRELSIVDDLTQLYNSRHFYFQLKIELDRSNRYEQPLTLLLLDLDNFKAFNDAYGHIEGDQVLRRLGRVVKRCLRETDFAFRYGGEEFTILLPMTTSAEGSVTAERIRTEFKKETFSPAPGQDVHVTVSIGLAQYKKKEEMKAFVHRVDQLMYRGKKNGKDKVCSEL